MIVLKTLQIAQSPNQHNRPQKIKSRAGDRLMQRSFSKAPKNEGKEQTDVWTKDQRNLKSPDYAAGDSVFISVVDQRAEQKHSSRSSSRTEK